MRHSPSSHSKEFFNALESRRYLSNPVISDMNADTLAAYPDKTITITVHATGDAGVRAVVFWLDRDNADGVHRFVANSNDQPLGEVYTPDAGTTDQFTFRITVDPSWPDEATIAADVVDTAGNFSNAPSHFVTINARPKPFVVNFTAETLPNGDVHLIAATSNDGQTTPGNNVLGVTFFVDQNGNNQWDPGTDIDLGASTAGASGVFTLTVTPQAGWNTTWFSASAFDLRASNDNFGPNRSTVLRNDALPPVINSIRIQADPNQFDPSIIYTGKNILVTVTFDAPQGIHGGSLFFDANQNGIWDWGVDTELQARFGEDATNTLIFTTTANALIGHGWQSFGVVIQDNSGRGENSWSSVTTGWANIDNTPWVESGSVNPPTITVGTSSVDMTFIARDDEGVRSVHSAFIDVNGNGIDDGGLEASGTNFTLLNLDRRAGIWRMTFDTHALPAGTYAINIWLDDYQNVSGPRTLVPFVVSVV